MNKPEATIASEADDDVRSSRKSRQAAAKLLDKEVKAERLDKDKPAKLEWLLGPKKAEELPEPLKDDEPVSAERAPEDDFSEEEITAIAAALRQAAQSERQQHVATDPVEIKVNQKLDTFDDKIEAGEDQELALSQVLAEDNIGLPKAETSQPPAREVPSQIPELPTAETTEADNTEAVESEPLVSGGEGGGGDHEPPTTFDRPEDDDHGLQPSARPNIPVTPAGPAIHQGVPAATLAARERASSNDDFLAGALFGGVIGYLIGRRRGRIKTEKKLLPVQKKLESKVLDLKQQLDHKEQLIRKAVTEKARQEQQQPNQQWPTAEAAVVTASAEAIKPQTASELKQPALDRQEAKAAQSLHVGPKASELIGQLIVSGEAVSKTKERVPIKPKPAEVDPQQTKDEQLELKTKRVETMNRTELLAASQKIIVDGTSLRQIYETHLVGEKGLRRLVAEHLKGGDVKKALRREIVEREIDFERDPAMRDMASSDASGPAASSSTDLNQMISQASAKLAPSSEEAAFYKAKADFELRELSQQQKQRKTADAIFAVVIAALVAAVVILFLMHH